MQMDVSFVQMGRQKGLLCSLKKTFRDSRCEEQLSKRPYLEVEIEISEYGSMEDGRSRARLFLSVSSNSDPHPDESTKGLDVDYFCRGFQTRQTRVDGRSVRTSRS